MTAPIGPGDWVECIDDQPRRPRHRHIRPPVTAGQIYQVAAVGVSNTGRAGLTLAGVALPPPIRWLVADRFRPVYRPDETLLARLMQPVPGVETPSRVKEEA